MGDGKIDAGPRVEEICDKRVGGCIFAIVSVFVISSFIIAIENWRSGVRDLERRRLGATAFARADRLKDAFRNCEHMFFGPNGGVRSIDEQACEALAAKEDPAIAASARRLYAPEAPGLLKELAGYVLVPLVALFLTCGICAICVEPLKTRFLRVYEPGREDLFAAYLNGEFGTYGSEEALALYREEHRHFVSLCLMSIFNRQCVEIVEQQMH